MNGLEYLIETEQVICDLYQGDLTTLEIDDALLSEIVGKGYCPNDAGLEDAKFCDEDGGRCDDCWRQVLEGEVRR